MEAAVLAIPTFGRLTSSSKPGRFARGLARGDTTVLDKVHAEYGPTVLGYLINVLGDRGTAEDVHQQVFLEVWQRGKSYDPSRASVLTWIMTIARSRAIDELRRRRPEPKDPSESPALAHAADTDPESSPDALVERWRVAHLLSRLRSEEAELLRMRFFEGLSQTEISERTGIALGTVKTRMVAAMERLRDLIEEEGA